MFLGVLPADLLRVSSITGGLELSTRQGVKHRTRNITKMSSSTGSFGMLWGRSNSMQKGLSHRLFLSASRVAADASFGIALGVAWIPL